MARNFRIKNKNNKKKSFLCLQLFGDFDGASADQLLQLVNRIGSKVQRIAIDTSGLRHIHSFGIAVFQPRIARVNSGRTQVSITGKFRGKFSNP